MPLIDGEKYACQSCIKGHRVSGCNHTDRELHHINPKGRPVKQCEHCRGARKSKSHHAKCDCGDKKDKDKHKDKADAKGESSHAGPSDDGHSNHHAVHDSRCACHSGAKCICGIKKDILDLRLDTKQSLHDARAKPKLTATHSESTLTVFANGHHKPCHRNNNTAHVSGAPYKIPRPHTLHGSAAFAAFSQNANYGQPETTPSTRSMDTFSLSNTDFYAMLGSAQRSVDSLPITPLTGSLDVNGLPADPLFTGQGSNFGQEGNSPSDSGLSDTIPTTQWPWASSVTPVSRNFGFGSLSTSPSQDCLPNLENDWSIPSAGLNPIWSAGDLPLDPSKLTDTLTQPISHSGESKQSVPGLTTASSTAHSEIGEPTLFGDMEFPKHPQSAASESLFWEDSPVYRLATSGPTDSRSAPTSIPATASPESQGLDLDFAKDLSSVSNGLTTTGPNDGTPVFTTADFSDARAIVMPNNLDDVVSNDPWLLDQNNAFGGLGPFDMSYQSWL
ncbi:hypothetical protein BS50DRAFT_191578 [Corynespora cassiicola Philippines]|uniref:Copper-fist domain-containing protein n=1 Tax=Corynespora cassiicola Philippines TaxID=1448308 RepID=A0A2T2P7H0_CORCC|nr:hypothetical protein BS50DRAFT_191578 [Corynespora cassiicola Philippines]